MKKQQALDSLKGGLIVSCQALRGEPLYLEQGGVMPRIAAAMQGVGAAGIRCNSERDIREIRAAVELPLIGLIKQRYEGYFPYITPTLKEVEAVVRAGADIVAVDATASMHPGGLRADEFIRQIKEKYDILVMADISTEEEAQAALRAGADLVGTTMAGYTPYTVAGDGPDFELLQRLVRCLACPVVGEGRVHTPAQAKRALQLGAFAVVVGGAITRPQEIAQRFIKEVFA